MIAAVINLVPLLGPMRTDLVALYPDLAPLRKAVKAGDWPSVCAYYSGLPPRADQSVATRLVASTRGAERFLQGAVDRERESSLARSLLGARFVVQAWDARGALRAQHVKASQWRVFHSYLERAERLLADATAIDPANAAAWTERITVARGLGLGADEARRRYEQAAEYCDAPYVAQAQLIQNFCPKWGGSTGRVHAFARECLEAAKPGSLGGAVVADGHIEHALTLGYLSQLADYLGQRKIREEISAAAAQTVLHPEFDPTTHGAAAAHSAFAFAFYVGGDNRRAAPHLAALGRATTWYPWEVLFGRGWKNSVRRARRAARRS